MAQRYWLMKTEPTCFSIRDLAAEPRQTTCWSGVRNFQARNYMREMQSGDRVLFYHSSANPPAVAGTAVIVREAYADHTALDSADEHFDPKASAADPIWQMVDIRLESIFSEPIGLDALRGLKPLAKMELLRKGSRLSVQPVTKEEFETVLNAAKRPGKKPAVNATAKTAKRKRAKA